jgi:hypothetical protein
MKKFELLSTQLVKRTKVAMITELLQRFIEKAETHAIGQPFRGSPTEIVNEALGTRTYHGLDIKASFGQGLATAVPWIGFFAFEQKTEKGIYPVFLYFKEQRRLVLAYGISETHPPDRQWTKLDGKETIREYFAHHDLGVPARYGSSFVHGVYDTTGELDEAEIERDLDTVISEFREIFENNATTNSHQQDLLNAAILNALDDPDINELLADPVFRFEKARRALIELENFPASSDFLNQLWRDYDSAAGDFTSKIEHFSTDSDEYRLLVLMSKVISYCDVNAANKNYYNEYEDKRTIARAGIRQGNWIRNLITYKLNGNNKQGITDIIGNALTYLKNPTLELTMLSERHREMV